MNVEARHKAAAGKPMSAETNERCLTRSDSSDKVDT